MADGEQMELSSLPDDLTFLVLQFCTFVALLSLEATCHRMKRLLQPPGAWRLPCDVHSLVGDDNQRAAVEAVHAVRTGHVARALVHKLVRRNCAEVFEEHPGMQAFEPSFPPDPLFGYDEARGDEGFRALPALYEFLCKTCRRAPARTIPTLRGLDELMLVIELRHSSDHHLDRCWVVQPTEGDNANYDFGSMYIADFVIGEAQAEPFPFDDDAFLVVWAVHRASKAVALLHAAAPEGAGHNDGDTVAESPISPAGQALCNNRSDRCAWRAASLVPRWRPLACQHRVIQLPTDMMIAAGYPGCLTDDREALSLSTHVRLQPTWLRAGSTADDQLIHPRAAPGGALPTGVDFVATAWRAASLSIELFIEGAQSNAASDRPSSSTSETHPDVLVPDDPRHPDHVQQQPGETKRSYGRRCARGCMASDAPFVDASKAWARSKLLEQLTTNVLWLAPRAFRTAKNAQELENRVNALLFEAYTTLRCGTDRGDPDEGDEYDEGFSDEDDDEGDGNEGGD